MDLELKVKLFYFECESLGCKIIFIVFLILFMLVDLLMFEEFNFDCKIARF